MHRNPPNQLPSTLSRLIGSLLAALFLLTIPGSTALAAPHRLLIPAEASEDIRAFVRWYAETTGTNYRNVKVKGNRQVEGTYFQFKVENYRGSDFTINSIKTVPIVQSLGKSN